MELFTEIEGANCIIKDKRGMFKQLPLFHQGKFVFVKVGSAFAGLCYKIDHQSCWCTTNPDIKVIAMDDFDHHFESIAGMDNIRYGMKRND